MKYWRTFELLLSRYKIGLETSMKGYDFIFECFQLLYYKCQKRNLNCGELYTESLDCIKKQKNNNKACQWWW